MQSKPSQSGSAKHGPVRVSGWAGSAFAAAAILAAGTLVFSQQGTLPAQADPNVTTGEIQTPFGRAPMTFADIVDKVKPAVVSISVTNGGAKKTAKNDKDGNKGEERRFGGIPNLPDDHPLNEFFKNLPKEFKGPFPQMPSQSQGSGFVISEDGYVVTNNHVIDGAGQIEVLFDRHNKHEADLVGTDPRTDLALLKITTKGKTFPFVKFTEKPSRVGDWVIAVGNPFGLGGSVTAGILSAHGRDIGSGPYDFLQIDAAVNKGNSGGPTFNLDGEVIGVNTAIFSPSGGNVGIAFAVPAKTALDVIDQLKNEGTVRRGWLGVRIQNIDEDMAASLGLEKPKGALVTDVTKNGPAEAAGLKTQDAIVEVNGSKIEDSRDLARKIAAYAPKSDVKVKVWRESAMETVTVKLGRFPTTKAELAALEEGREPPADTKPTELKRLGLTLVPVTGTSGAKIKGVAIADVDRDSDAAREGLRPGDVILEAQGIKVANAADVVAGVKKAIDLKRPAVRLHVQSGNTKRFIAVRLKDEEKNNKRD